MNAAAAAPIQQHPRPFELHYQSHLKHLVLKGLQPKTIDAYARAVRRVAVGARFDHRIDALTAAQLTDYFSELVQSHSWSSVKLDLYGLKFFYTHVLQTPWVAPGLVKPPKSQRLPDVVTVEQARRIFAMTRVSATGCSSLPATAWGFAWARALCCNAPENTQAPATSLLEATAKKCISYERHTRSGPGSSNKRFRSRLRAI